LSEAPRPAAGRRPFIIRPLEQRDRPQLEALIRGVENFVPEEVACAIELVGLAAGPAPGSDDYRVLVADAGGSLLAYACFGPTPMTRHTFDLYWIANSSAVRGTGVGSALHEAVVAAVRAAGGRRIRVETSSHEAYGATLRFYERTGYKLAGRVEHFYKDDDHLLIFVCDISG
jgi:ribosomal protein S18 acetylase RimI-like enzyme